MNRRDFAKCGLGGLLASALALVPGRAKAEPKFPRWFMCRVVVYEVRAESHVWLHNTGIPAHRLWQWRTTAGGALARKRPTTMTDILPGVKDGHLREITAAEAEALLKPMKGSGQ